MKQTMVVLSLFFVTLYTFSQNVGINVDVPEATLHVHGTLRADSLAMLDSTDTSPTWSVVCDSVGNFFKKPGISIPTLIPPTEAVMEFEYGGTINAGDLVSVGDGRSAYMRCNGDAVFVQNESTNQTRWVAQGFTTIGGLVGIRAVVLKIPIVSGQSNTVVFSVCPAVGGIPDMGQAVSHTETFIGSGNSSGWSLFVFDPPLYAPPAASCFLVVRAYGPSNTSKVIRTVGESIAGNAMVTTNSGVTWSTLANRDLEVQIFETRHWPGKVYASHTTWIAETLRPDQATILATSGTVIVKDFYDRAHNVIGVALESGNAGDVKKISLGPVVTVSQTLVPGTRYYLSDNIGIIGTGMPASFFNVSVGFAVGTHRLLLVR